MDGLMLGQWEKIGSADHNYVLCQYLLSILLPGGIGSWFFRRQRSSVIVVSIWSLFSKSDLRFTHDTQAFSMLPFLIPFLEVFFAFVYS